MKTYLFLLMAVLVISGCKGPAGDKAEVAEAKEVAEAGSAASQLTIDTENSFVTWLGSKPAGQHPGTIDLESGTLQVEDGRVTAGNFVLDMNTVQARDEAMNAERNAQLTNHLKSEDFFEVAKYPTATFSIVSVEDISARASEEALELEGATHYVTGNLTLRDITKSVSFPAIIEVGDTGVAAKAKFTIDRTEWGMHYKSDKSLGDQIIHPRVQVGFSIKAK